MKRWLVSLIVLGFLAPAVWAAPLCLQFEVQRTVSSAGETAEGDLQKVRVVLADDYLEFEDKDGRVVHDFTSKQSHLVNGDNYVRRSLYADIGFRVAESRNRWALIETLKSSPKASAALREGALGQIVSVEHLFGIDDEVSEANITKSAGATISYAFQGTLLAEFSAKGRSLTPAQSKAFVRFLRYYCGGHPDILGDVRGRAVLPEDIRIVVSNVNEVVSFRLHLLEMDACDPARPSFSGLRPTELPPEPLGTMVALVLQLSPEGASSARAAVKTQADQDFARGKILESALGYFELLLMEGGPPPAALADSRAVFEKDPNTKQLFEALVLGAADPAQAGKLLQSLETRAPSKAHVLKIFRAGMLLPLTETAKARDLYLEALMANPAIAGAWKDLGDIYHSNYEMDIAWLCWDTGRLLAPGHAMLGDISKLEQVLRSNNPGFF